VAQAAADDPEFYETCGAAVRRQADELRQTDQGLGDNPKATGAIGRTPVTPPPTDATGDLYKKRVWAWIRSNTDTQAAYTEARNPRQFGSSRRAFQYALGAGIDLDEVEAALKQAQIDNGAVRDNGEWKVDDTFRRARAAAEADGPDYLDDRDRPNGYGGADTTLTDANGEPIVDKLDEVDADGQPTEAAKEAQDAWANAVRKRAMDFRLNDEAKRFHAAWKVQESGLTPCPGVVLEEFLAVPDEDAQYRITDLLPTGGRAMLSAQQKAGKTSLLGALIRSLADGTPFLGRFDVLGCERVTLFDAELDERMLRRWLRRQGIENRHRVKVHSLRGKLSTFDFRDETLRRHWVNEVRGSDFVILDCLRPVLDAFGLSEDKEAGRFLVAWDEFLAEAGASESVVAHHMGHTGERARGDSRLQDWPDVNWRIIKESQTVKDDDQSVGIDGGRRFFSAHGRDVNVAEKELQLDDSGELTLTNGTRRSAKVDDAIAPLIEIIGRNDIGDGLSKNALSERLQERGVARNVARKAIDKAVKEGIALRAAGPNRTQLHIINPSWTEP